MSHDGDASAAGDVGSQQAIDPPSSQPSPSPSQPDGGAVAVAALAALSAGGALWLGAEEPVPSNAPVGESAPTQPAPFADEEQPMEPASLGEAAVVAVSVPVDVSCMDPIAEEPVPTSAAAARSEAVQSQMESRVGPLIGESLSLFLRRTAHEHGRGGDKAPPKRQRKELLGAVRVQTSIVRMPSNAASQSGAAKSITTPRPEMRRTDHGLEQAKLATLTDFLVANGVDDAGADGGALDGWTVEDRAALSHQHGWCSGFRHVLLQCGRHALPLEDRGPALLHGLRRTGGIRGHIRGNM
jgi:hypothetical protein